MTRKSMIDLAFSKVIGHRGACGHAPENTMVSFMKAKALGVDWVEFDIQLTQDEKLVVFHDLDFTRLANRPEILTQMNYVQCSQIDVGSYFAPEFRGQQVPLLEDVLRYLLTVNITPNIEIKSDTLTDLLITEQLLALLERVWPVDRMPPLVSSFDLPALQQLRELDQNIAIAFLCEELPADWRGIAEALKCYAIHTDHSRIDYDDVQAVHAEGYKMACYTVNDADEAKKLFQWGVDAVFSDYPERIFAVI